eukprot:scaffold49883_cov29-Tisochrysis_lutea.AAC.2
MPLGIESSHVACALISSFTDVISRAPPFWALDNGKTPLAGERCVVCPSSGSHSRAARGTS